MRPRGGRARRGAGTAPRTDLGRGRQAAQRGEQRVHPKTSSSSSPRRASSPRQPHSTPPPGSSEDEGLRGGSRGFPWWHVPKQGPKPAQGSFPRKKQADGLLLASGWMAEEEKSHVSPFGHFFSFFLLLSCLFTALLWGVWPYPGPRVVRCPPSPGWRRPWKGPGGLPIQEGGPVAAPHPPQ